MNPNNHPTARTAIWWLPADQGGRRSIPTAGYRTVVNFRPDPDWPEEAFTLVLLDVEALPLEHLKLATVCYLVDGAPHENLASGHRFALHEGRRAVAYGVVLPAELHDHFEIADYAMSQLVNRQTSLAGT